MQNETAERIKDVIAIDPIAEFEVRSGKSYKTNSEDENFAMMSYAMQHSALKAESLKKQRDTYHGMPLDDYLAVITEFGFVNVLCDEFISQKWGHREKYLIFWHPDGLLLSFDTWGGKSVNGGKVYYNWVPAPDIDNRFRYTSSGHYTRNGVWVGDHDCREGLIANMTAMKSAGAFLSEWEEQPFLWLLSYQDTDKLRGDQPNRNAHKAKTEERILRLPNDVQKAVRVG